jgi:hypothetical protein
VHQAAHVHQAAALLDGRDDGLVRLLHVPAGWINLWICGCVERWQGTGGCG